MELNNYHKKVVEILNSLNRQDLAGSKGLKKILKEAYEWKIEPAMAAKTLDLAFPLNPGCCPGCGQPIQTQKS